MKHIEILVNHPRSENHKCERCNGERSDSRCRACGAALCHQCLIQHPCTRITRSACESDSARVQHRVQPVIQDSSQARAARSSSRSVPNSADSKSSHRGNSNMTHDAEGPLGSDSLADTSLEEGEDDCKVLSEAVSKLTALTAKNFNRNSYKECRLAGKVQVVHPSYGKS